MSEGWISLHRKFTEWEWYKNEDVKSVFLHLLLKANYEAKIWKGIKIQRGQVITSRKHLAEETGLTERKIRTCLSKLKATNEITIKTTNKFSIITIVKYNTYQNTSIQTTNKTTDNMTTTNNTIIDYTKLDLLFNYLIYKEEDFKNLTEIDREGIVAMLKRLDLYTTEINYIPVERLFELKIKYYAIQELYSSAYKVYINNLTKETIDFIFLNTKKYNKLDINDPKKMDTFIRYFIKSLQNKLKG